jgi:hypothetical protein
MERIEDTTEKQRASGAAAAAPAPTGESVCEAPDRRAQSDRRAADDRRTGLDRRSGADRRSELDRRGARGEKSEFDRRRGPGRRRTDYRRAAEEGHMNEEQLDFLRAVDEYKRVNDRPFPTLTEILDLALYLGYRKVAPVGEFQLIKPRETPLRKSELRRAAERAEQEED